MNIKSFIALAVTALTVAACSGKDEAPKTEATEQASTPVDLNELNVPGHDVVLTEATEANK